MKFKLLSLTAAILGVLTAVSVQTSSLPAQSQQPLKDFKNINLEEFGIKRVPARKDPKTGFIVGGKNPTSLIKGLEEINGRTIADLERDMRPGAKSDVGSDKGFLGADEKLLDVLAEDNKYVIDELRLTHQELARHLHAMGAIGTKFDDPEILYHGRRFKITVVFYRGYQLSPFYDGTKTNADATVQNLDNGKELGYSLLVPHMVERYGFYEGKGTPYRVEPREVIEVFDFLKNSPTEASNSQVFIWWVIGLAIVLVALVGGAVLWRSRNRSQGSPA